MSVTACPNCRSAMQARSFERLYGRTLVLDLCEGCQGLWFDDMELLQLTPGATLELFTALQRDGASRSPLVTRLKCPRCPARLRESHDLQRSTRFTFFGCPRGHGRYLTYFQFLRAKNFVRNLTAREVEALRRRIRQVNCANCGAPVDIDRGAACPFCRTPVAMIDPDQVRKVVEELRDAEARRTTVDPTWPVQALAERARAERTFEAERDLASLWDGLHVGTSIDLVGAGLRLASRLLLERR